MQTEGIQEQARRQDVGQAGQDFANQDYAQRDQQRRTRSARAADDEEAPKGYTLPSVASVALRSTALMFDLQLETARAVWQSQARSATLFGAPDFSHLFRVGDDRARRVFSLAADQIASSVRQAADTLTALQREIAHVAEQNTIDVTDRMQQQLVELGRQTERGLREIRQMSFQALDAAREAAVPDEEREREETARGDRERGTQGGAERRSIPRKHS